MHHLGPGIVARMKFMNFIFIFTRVYVINCITYNFFCVLISKISLGDHSFTIASVEDILCQHFLDMPREAAQAAYDKGEWTD